MLWIFIWMMRTNHAERSVNRMFPTPLFDARVALPAEQLEADKAVEQILLGTLMSGQEGNVTAKRLNSYSYGTCSAYAKWYSAISHGRKTAKLHQDGRPDARVNATDRLCESQSICPMV